MSTLNILCYPDPRLRQRAAPVPVVDEEIRRLAADMAQTMYGARGIGLAATQVGVPLRVLVLDISEGRDALAVYVNPEIIASEGSAVGDEGCLSVPDVCEAVERAQIVTVRALGLDGQVFEQHAEGLLAVCLQHELDHLNGILFVDHLSSLKRERLRKKAEKQTRQRAESVR